VPRHLGLFGFCLLFYSIRVSPSPSSFGSCFVFRRHLPQTRPPSTHAPTPLVGLPPPRLLFSVGFCLVLVPLFCLPVCCIVVPCLQPSVSPPPPPPPPPPRTLHPQPRPLPSFSPLAPPPLGSNLIFFYVPQEFLFWGNPPPPPPLLFFSFTPQPPSPPRVDGGLYPAPRAIRHGLLPLWCGGLLVVWGWGPVCGWGSWGFIGDSGVDSSARAVFFWFWGCSPPLVCGWRWPPASLLVVPAVLVVL